MLVIPPLTCCKLLLTTVAHLPGDSKILFHLALCVLANGDVTCQEAFLNSPSKAGGGDGWMDEVDVSRVGGRIIEI